MLIFEKSRAGRQCSLFPPCDVELKTLPEGDRRKTELHLPELSETELSRHYTELSKKSRGVNDGFYPLGSCTMKYNPKVNDDMAGLEGFADIHPLQPESTVQGAMEVIQTIEKLLCEITGMDRLTVQPAAGAHGEFTGLMLIKAYHESRNDFKRDKIIIPDAAHGTNPASATMAGYKVVTIPSNERGLVDMEKLKAVLGDDVAGLMLTNPNTVGLFDDNILEITKLIHDCGGLNYYDGANLNAVVGCKKLLADFLPSVLVEGEQDKHFVKPVKSIGDMKAFYGNFLVVVRALTYILTLGKEGIPEACKNAVLNANYMRYKLKDLYTMAYDEVCMHEFVMSLQDLKDKTGVSAMDIAKSLLDNGMHPPTMYFPLIVHEALMIEPTETESKETLDQAIEVFRKLYKEAEKNPEALHNAPVTTPVGRLDEVKAAREPVLRYQWT